MMMQYGICNELNFQLVLEINIWIHASIVFYEGVVFSKKTNILLDQKEL